MKKREYTYQDTLYTCYFAYITQAIIVNLPPTLFIVFRERFGLSYAQLSFLVLLNFFTQIGVDLLSIKITKLLGYRRYVVIAHILASIGLVMMGIFPEMAGSGTPAYAALLLCTVLFSAGSGIIEVLVSPIVEAVPGDAKASTMSLLHGFYSWGQVIVVMLTTIILALIGHDLWYVLPIVWAVIPAFNIYRFSVVPINELEDGDEKSVPLRELFRKKVFICIVLMMICSGASEQSMSQWASLFAERGLGVTKTVGDLLGPCLFAVFMGVGRTAYGLFGQKINPAKAIWLLSFGCVACYAMTVFSSNAVLGLAACALCGFMVSLMWPGMLSVASAAYPGGGTPMFSVLAMGGDIGCSFGPWLTGMVSDSVIKYSTLGESAGLHYGLGAAAIFPVIMVLIMPVIFAGNKNKPSKKGS